jgi:hypothetical protein
MQVDTFTANMMSPGSLIVANVPFDSQLDATDRINDRCSNATNYERHTPRLRFGFRRKTCSVAFPAEIIQPCVRTDPVPRRI